VVPICASMLSPTAVVLAGIRCVSTLPIAESVIWQRRFGRTTASTDSATGSLRADVLQASGARTVGSSVSGCAREEGADDVFVVAVERDFCPVLERLVVRRIGVSDGATINPCSAGIASDSPLRKSPVCR
jgi:predicted ThiF/HesA family dinucleotide-utilizing enzyme